MFSAKYPNNGDREKLPFNASNWFVVFFSRRTFRLGNILG